MIVISPVGALVFRYNDGDDGVSDDDDDDDGDDDDGDDDDGDDDDTYFMWKKPIRKKWATTKRERIFNFLNIYQIHAYRKLCRILEGINKQSESYRYMRNLVSKLYRTEGYLEPYQTSKMDLFPKKVNGWKQKAPS